MDTSILYDQLCWTFKSGIDDKEMDKIHEILREALENAEDIGYERGKDSGFEYGYESGFEQGRCDFTDGV